MCYIVRITYVLILSEDSLMCVLTWVLFIVQHRIQSTRVWECMCACVFVRPCININANMLAQSNKCFIQFVQRWPCEWQLLKDSSNLKNHVYQRGNEMKKWSRFCVLLWYNLTSWYNSTAINGANLHLTKILLLCIPIHFIRFSTASIYSFFHKGFGCPSVC